VECGEKGGSSTYAASHTFHPCLTARRQKMEQREGLLLGPLQSQLRPERERTEQKGGPPFVPTSRARCKGAVLLEAFGLFGSGPPFGVTQKEGPLLGERRASFWVSSNEKPPCRVTSATWRTSELCSQCEHLPARARFCVVCKRAGRRLRVGGLQSSAAK
jgi:hypothetical protein